MHKLVTFLKKKKDPTSSWASLDKEDDKPNKHHHHHHNHNNHNSNSNNRKSTPSTLTDNNDIVTKKNQSSSRKSSKQKSKQQQPRNGSDDSDEMIPEEVRTISKTIDFTKAERKWLVNLNLSFELIDEHLPILLNILNFLSRKEGIYYRFASPLPAPSSTKQSYKITKPSSSSSSLAPPSSPTSTSSSTSSIIPPVVISTPIKSSIDNNNPPPQISLVSSGPIDQATTNKQPSLSSSTTIEGIPTTTTTTTTATIANQPQIMDNTIIVQQQSSPQQTSSPPPSTSQDQTTNVVPVTTAVISSPPPQPPPPPSIPQQILTRGDYNRIFIEPGKFYLFPEQESLAMARLVAEEEDPSKLFRVADSNEIKGAFGTVYQVSYSNNQYHNVNELALKKMDHKSERNRRNNLNEIALLRYLKHPNVVTYVNCYEKNDEEIWLVMEYMDGGTIKEAISNFTFTEKYVAYIIKNILHALEYLHSLKIAHRDLKSENIMLNSKAEVKIIDFGFSIDLTLLGGDIHMCGSPFWMAPEQIQEKPHDCSVDIWSLGIIVAEMMRGVVPHHRSKIKAMFLTASVGVKFTREKKYSSHWSNELFDFLESTLQMDPKKRPTATQLLEHPFIATAATKQEMLELLPLLFMSKTISKYSSMRE